MSDVPAGWVEQVKQLQQILSEGHSVAREIVGEPPPGDEMAAKQPECSADQLSSELIGTIDVALRLVKQLQRIKEQF